MVKTQDVRFELTLEEIGPHEDWTVGVEIMVRVAAGEPAIPYYRDGSGYPGSAPHAELVDVFVFGVEDGDGPVIFNKEEMAKLVFDHLYNNPDLYVDEAIELANEEYEEYDED